MALTLDPITVNTELAENYLKKYNNFDAWPEPGTFWNVEKYPDDKIEYDNDTFKLSKNKKSIGSNILRKLVEKVKESESIFYQLEYMIRKTDKADFQNYITLMCQHLQCDDDSWNLGYADSVNILMTEKTPLYVLGCAAAAKSSDVGLNIVTTQKMAPISNLFVSLCTQLGWTVNFICINNVSDFYDLVVSNISSYFSEEDAVFECTGVVTESADIDSALDVFINSSATAPWKLQRIYVQESVYDEVKEALAARSARGVVPACAEAFATNGKVFVVDALSAESGAGAARVPLEAYRTAKELCALLREQAAPALSLWAADAQLAHEVALAAPARLVWINEHASFHGPAASSLPIFERLYTGLTYLLHEPHLRNLRKLWTVWNKLSKNERLDAIMIALEGMSSVPGGYESLVDLQNDILNARDESFASVENGKICFCIERQPRFEDIFDFDITSKKPVVSSITALVNGKAIIYRDFVSDSVTVELLDLLEKAGVPVMYEDDSSPTTRLPMNISVKKLKVIRSNFGTIFAN